MQTPSFTLRVAAAAWAALGLAGAVSAETAGGRWIDAKPLANWNRAGNALPRGPAADMEGIRECEKRGDQARKAEPTPETRQVAAAGWLGAEVQKRAGDTVYVFARNAVDGMCRPLQYQYFVFVRGQFAGTVAPRPMDSRTDGGGYLEAVEARRFTATFARYRPDDPLCCPSRISTVTYEIRQTRGGAGGFVVVPLRAATKDAR